MAALHGGELERLPDVSGDRRDEPELSLVAVGDRIPLPRDAPFGQDRAPAGRVDRAGGRHPLRKLDLQARGGIARRSRGRR